MKASLIKPTDDQLNLADIDTIKVIGKGAGGTVQLVQHKWTGQFFALKVSTFTWTSLHTYSLNSNARLHHVTIFTIVIPLILSVSRFAGYLIFSFTLQCLLHSM